ncbi:MAG: SMC-Scp complex subunit ScpB [Candidatus Binatia bacterium]|nr:SMC-Scp complex subunit ScpB [Candidatus Binatia bacterium]
MSRRKSRLKKKAVETQAPEATSEETDGGTEASAEEQVEASSEASEQTSALSGDAAAEAAGDESSVGDDGAEAALEDGTGDEAEIELPPLVAVLEAALFASAEPVPLTRLTRVLGAWNRDQVVAGLKELGERQEREGSGMRVVETAGGFQLRSLSEYAPWVRKFFTEKPPRLSRAVLETLAVVAYRQPATRGEVEAVRGVNCDAVLGALTARGLVQVIGRRQSPGRPVEYGTTQEFLELFSLKELAELPPLPDASSLANLIDDARLEEEVEAAGSEGDLDASEPAVEPADENLDGTTDGQEAAAAEENEADGAHDGATAEDSEPSGDRLPEISGGADSGGEGSGQREGDSRAGSEG